MEHFLKLVVDRHTDKRAYRAANTAKKYGFKSFWPELNTWQFQNIDEILLIHFIFSLFKDLNNQSEIINTYIILSINSNI